MGTAMKDKKIKKIKLNVPLGGFLKGSEIDFSRGNVKLDRFWTNRIKDSSIDNCVTIIDSDQLVDFCENNFIETKSNKKSRKYNVDK